MSRIDFEIKRLNKYFETHVFECYFFASLEIDLKLKTKIKFTGVKEYLSVGTPTKYLQYTITILPSGLPADTWSKLYADVYGKDVPITTTSREYYDVCNSANRQLENFLIYFGVEMPCMCTRVINKVTGSNISEGLILEDSYDSVVRQIVRDILTIVKNNEKGEFGLPEDLRPDEVYYEFPQLKTPLQIFISLERDDSVDTFDIDGDYYEDEDLIDMTIQIGKNFNHTNFYKLVGDLNELVRHELRHVRQVENGIKLPSKEIKSPKKYYSQEHELDDQRAGFRRKKKVTGIDYETVVRNWFKENQHKHNLKPKQAEEIIQKILNEK